ncbi:MAG TPA: family 1 glycosylhydrolase [Chthonomonadaceae bacterium]|nr:family 1 glycosylhydrolase [Chthonomonadaceae bacterium]
MKDQGRRTKTGRSASPSPEAIASPPAQTESSTGGFLFATGIECSYPTIAGPKDRRVRVDELEKTFHYRHWQEDLALVREMGLRYLRYGPPYYRISLAPDRYDWEFTDQVFAEMQRLGIVPIVDLCHFGVPDWIGDFQNPDWPEQFSRYAGAFAARFPWVQFYTPVNEIYVCAKLSTLAGLWNERKRGDDRAFVTALKHLCRANLLAMVSILHSRPDAVFIQSESAEYFHLGSGEPAMIQKTNWENQRRFLSFDLLTSHHPDAQMGFYLLDNGMTRAEYDWFMSHGLADRMILGNDFYERNEQIVMPDGQILPAGEVFGWSVITQQYFDRYRRPVMHTETNNIRSDVDAPRWLWKEFFNVRNLRQQGVPVLGFTWYSLLDQVDWDSGLALDRGVINSVGLYNLQRRPHPVAEAYKELLRQFGGESLLPGNRLFTFAQKPAAAQPAVPAP